MNELNCRGSKGGNLFENSNYLKDLISCKRSQFERKGKDRFVDDCYESYFLFTNNAFSKCLKIESSDMRFCLLEASNKYKSDAAFWTRIYEELKNTEVISSAFHYLSNLDISDFSPKNLPKTNKLLNKKLCAPITVKFLLDVFTDYEYWRCVSFEHDGENICISKVNLFKV